MLAPLVYFLTYPTAIPGVPMALALATSGTIAAGKSAIMEEQSFLGFTRDFLVCALSFNFPILLSVLAATIVGKYAKPYLGDTFEGAIIGAAATFSIAYICGAPILPGLLIAASVALAEYSLAAKDEGQKAARFATMFGSAVALGIGVSMIFAFNPIYTFSAVLGGGLVMLLNDQVDAPTFAAIVGVVLMVAAAIGLALASKDGVDLDGVHSSKSSNRSTGGSSTRSCSRRGCSGGTNLVCIAGSTTHRQVTHNTTTVVTGASVQPDDVVNGEPVVDPVDVVSGVPVKGADHEVAAAVVDDDKNSPKSTTPSTPADSTKVDDSSHNLNRLNWQTRFSELPKWLAKLGCNGFSKGNSDLPF